MILPLYPRLFLYLRTVAADLQSFSSNDATLVPRRYLPPCLDATGSRDRWTLDTAIRNGHLFSRSLLEIPRLEIRIPHVGAMHGDASYSSRALDPPVVVRSRVNETERQ